MFINIFVSKKSKFTPLQCTFIFSEATWNRRHRGLSALWLPPHRMDASVSLMKSAGTMETAVTAAM